MCKSSTWRWLRFPWSDAWPLEILSFARDNHLGKLREDLCYAKVSLCGSIIVLYPQVLAELFPVLPAYVPLLLLNITLSSNNHFLGALLAVLIYLISPCSQIGEAGLACAVISQNDSICLLVVGLRNSAEALLPRCVPYLQLYHLFTHLDLLVLEVYAH